MAHPDSGHGPDAASGVDGGDRAAAVGRFAAWLAELSPYYRELRSPVWVHDGAPELLGRFWRTVGWAPGIVFSCDESQRPEQGQGRAAADKAFRKWFDREQFVSDLRLPEPVPQALWDRLPPRCWVQHVECRGGCHRGELYYVDEDAGDDPPLMRWDTSEASRRSGPALPEVIAASCVEYLIDLAVTRLPGVSVRLPAPTEVGLFAPVYPRLWEIAPGVWGRGGRSDWGDPTQIVSVVAPSPRAYLDFLLNLPPDQLSGCSIHADGLHMINVADARGLSPESLAAQGFPYARRDDGRTVAVARLDGVTFAVERQLTRGQPAGESCTCTVSDEDYRALRALLKREKVRAYQHLRLSPGATVRPPTATERARAARLAEKAARGAGTASTVAGSEATAGGSMATAGGSAATAPGSAATAGGSAATAPGSAATRARPKRARPVTPVRASDPTAQAALRAEAASLRAWLLAAHPDFELAPPELAADEPPLIRTLWEELGYSDELRDVVGWPDRASSRDELAGVLEGYRDGGSPLRRSALPSLFRLVGVDDQGSGLGLTDEDTPVDDPPVLSVNADTGEVGRWHNSYLTLIGERLADHAAYAQPSCTLVTDPPLGGLGEQLCPRLAPRIRHLAAGIRVHPRYDPSVMVCASTFADLVTWLTETTIVDRLALDGTDGVRQAAAISLTAFTPPPGLRTWQAPHGTDRCHVGTVEGVPILVHAADTVTLYTPRISRERATAIAAAAGWTR